MTFDTPTAIRTLRLFNEKAAKLDNLEFVRSIGSQEYGYSISYDVEEEFKVKRHGPSDEAVDAFVLTYRFFVQDNEPTSFRRMAELYANLPVETPWKEAAQNTRRDLNAFLDGLTQMIVGGHHITRRELHDVFLYGNLAHANKAKTDQFQEWARRDGLIPILQTEFIEILASVFGAIRWFHSANTDVLKLLEDLQPHAA
jgi:hypothetical protein